MLNLIRTTAISLLNTFGIVISIQDSNFNEGVDIFFEFKIIKFICTCTIFIALTYSFLKLYEYIYHTFQ